MENKEETQSEINEGRVVDKTTLKRMATKGRKPNKLVTVTLNIRGEHYVFLKTLASQWHMEVPNLIEFMVERIFPRDFIKFKTIVHNLFLSGMGISDILSYILMGERNEERILWLHSKKQKERNEDDTE